MNKITNPYIVEDISNKESQKLLLERFIHEFNIEGIELDKFKNELDVILSNMEIKPTEADLYQIFLAIFNNQFFTPINSIELIFTEQCNLKCDYCFVREKRNNKFSLQMAKSTIDFLNLYSANNKNVWVSILGGEPLLMFDVIDRLIDYCDSITLLNGKKFLFDATTNGTLLTEDILSRSKGRINYLLSIDGNKITHDKHRKFHNGEGSFEAVISKIPLILKYQSWLGTRMTICPDTVSELSRNVEFLYNRGINQFLLGVCYGPDWNEKALRIYEEELIKISEYYLKRIKNNDPFRITYFEKEENNNNCLNGRWGCRAGRNSVTILQNGDIYPCSKFVGLESFDCNEFLLGNVFDGITNLSMREKLFTMENKNFRKCSHCKESSSCVGGCIAENYNQNRSIYIPCKQQCEITKIQNSVLRKFWAEQEKASVEQLV